MRNYPDKSDSFPSRFETDVHPEIQPEMQPAFEFPGTYKKLHLVHIRMTSDKSNQDYLYRSPNIIALFSTRPA